MADEKQEEMSMDEILSSIKNILSENGEPVAETQPAAETADIVSEPAETVPEAKDDVLDLESSDISVADLPFSEDDNNILDLTADMRVDAAAPEIDVEAEPTDGLDGEIDIDRELEDVPEVAADVPAVEPIELPAVEAEAEKTEILLPEVNVIIDGIDSDPIYTPEDEASSQPLYKGDDGLLEETPEISTQADAFNIETLPIAETEPAAPEPEIRETVSEPAVQPHRPEAEKAAVPAAGDYTESGADAADVSASIINNFAKIFAGSEQAAPAPEPAKVSSSVKLGEDATLSDMVKASIRDMIAEQTVNVLVNDADIKALVSAEVPAQIKSWLDNNLPSMVEAVVKKEIERVMAKAGRN